MASVLWVGVAGDVDGFRRIAMPDQRPHLTLARARKPTDLIAAVGELDPFESSSFHVDEIHVMESHLRSSGQRGPRYETLETIPLESSRAPGDVVTDPVRDPRDRRP
jgi:2'-5' RNA ligase